MQAKDKFLEKFNLLILVFILCFCHKLFAENIYEKISNYNDELKNSQLKQGYEFQSETDTEVIAHAIDSELHSNATLIESVQNAV